MKEERQVMNSVHLAGEKVGAVSAMTTSKMEPLPIFFLYGSRGSETLRYQRVSGVKLAVFLGSGKSQSTHCTLQLWLVNPIMRMAEDAFVLVLFEG